MHHANWTRRSMTIHHERRRQQPSCQGLRCGIELPVPNFRQITRYTHDTVGVDATLICPHEHFRNCPGVGGAHSGCRKDGSHEPCKLPMVNAYVAHNHASSDLSIWCYMLFAFV